MPKKPKKETIKYRLNRTALNISLKKPPDNRLKMWSAKASASANLVLLSAVKLPV